MKRTSPREIKRFLNLRRATLSLLITTLVLLFGGSAVAQTPKQTEKPAETAPTQPAQSTTTAASPTAAQSSAQPAAESAASSTASTTASTTEPGATPAPSATPQPTGTQLDGSTYAVRLRDLEQRIEELKEQIRRSHTRLSLLSDTIMGSGGSGAYATIAFDNKMSGAFRLTRAVFVLDGAVQFNRADDSGALAEQKTIPIYRGSMPPGDHTLQVLLEFRGHGFGVFSYLKGYRFEVRSSHSFTIPQGKSLALQVVAYEKGGVTTALEQRPAVRYSEKSGSLDSVAQQPAASSQSTKSQPSKPPATGSVNTGVNFGATTGRTK